jgi:hypothetical protein
MRYEQRRVLLLALAALSLAAGCAGGSVPAPPHATPSPSASPGTLSLNMTFYGFPDNTPPSCQIAYPVIHQCAGGTGTYADPITYATDASELAPGTILYLQSIRKYGIMEDDCTECDADWNNGHIRHIDVWLNSDANSNVNAVLNCENELTQDPAQVTLNPASNLPVSSQPLFTDAGNICFTFGPAPTSSPVGNTPAPTPT